MRFSGGKSPRGKWSGGKNLVAYGGSRWIRKRLILAAGKSWQHFLICNRGVIPSKSLDRLTKIRNKVMHPIGAIPPNEEDFFFVREMQEKFDLTKWR
jgi:hypothetical protein